MYRAPTSLFYKNNTGSQLRKQDFKDPYSIYFLITRLDIKFELRAGIASSEVNDVSKVFDSNGILANAFPLSDGERLSTYLDVIEQSQPSDEQYQYILFELLIQNYSTVVCIPNWQLPRTITKYLKDLTAEDLQKEEKTTANQMYELLHLAEIFRAGYFSNDSEKVVKNF